jgi:hypothetical protein
MKKKIHYCRYCNKLLEERHKVYCNNKCQSDYQYEQYIKRWKDGLEDGLRCEYSLSNHIHRYMREKYGNKCSRCGWCEVNPFTGKVPLEIDHIDGNYLNNSEDNLDLICPNCHSLTSTYRALNKGRGRKERRKYDL